MKRLLALNLFLGGSISPSATYADIALGDDHNHHRLGNTPMQSGFLGGLLDDAQEAIGKYDPGFFGFDRGLLGKRREEITALGNNAPERMNILPGESHHYTFPIKDINRRRNAGPLDVPSKLRERAVPLADKPSGTTGNQMYISISTCDQPGLLDQTLTTGPAQLRFFVSKDSNNKKPSDDNPGSEVVLVEGIGQHNLSIDSDIYFTVSAESTPGFKGSYNYELAVSTDHYYAHYNESAYPVFFALDSDANSTLLLTNATTTANVSTPVYEQWMTSPAPYGVFVYPKDYVKLRGLTRSFCGLKDWALVRGNVLGDQNPSVKTNMIALGHSNPQPAQQIYINTLNGSTDYTAVMVLDGNSTANDNGVTHGGGTVFSAIDFKTKSARNCAVLYNLSFCTDVAYAVPANPANPQVSNLTDIANLGKFYDDSASRMYTNFTKSLAQIPCNTTASAQYSLARNCTDCANAYKHWLCAVSIPRCEDYNNPASYLAPKAEKAPASKPANANNSRNPIIDTTIKPGPYKEVLPCKDLCYELIQSCPASLQFACPLKGHGLEESYGNVEFGQQQATCNWPGRIWPINGATALAGELWGWMVVAGVMAIMMLDV